MITINAENLDFKSLNNALREASVAQLRITNAKGQRYIGCGSSGKTIIVEGVAGNATGAYLDGSKIFIDGNGQDAIGDTMNDGQIIISGMCGDTAGYAMRGGKIIIRGDAGYRTGIHMKAYQSHLPSIIIGGSAGSFLGEYLAGGIIVVLGLNKTGDIIGNFCGTGMHGGKIFLRCEKIDAAISKQVKVKKAEKEDLKEITPLISEFCELFGENLNDIMNSAFFVLTPNSENPYKQLYAKY